jgi:DNA-binding MarR family transcriptional regulator
MESENESKGSLEKSAIAAIIKRNNAMKILLYLIRDKDEEETYYLQRIADDLGINEMTAYSNLVKLIDAGIVEKSETDVDRRTKYYSITNKRLAEKAIEKYKRTVGFQLARFVPYEKRYCSQLKGDKRFQNACGEYGLTSSEGIMVILSCYKIEKESTGQDTIIWRKEQGYYEPEKEKSTTEVEDVW